MAIKFVQMTTEDSVIADVADHGESVVLKNPARLAMTNQGLGMMPYNPMIKDKEITIDKKFILYQANPDDEILNAYNAKFGSGLVLAGSGIITR